METSICISCNFTKSNTPPWVFFTLFKLYKWYKIAQHITFDQCSNSNQQLVVKYLAIMSAFSLRYLIAWDEGGNERAGDGNTVPRISSLKKKFNKMFTAKNVILSYIVMNVSIITFVLIYFFCNNLFFTVPYEHFQTLTLY